MKNIDSKYLIQQLKNLLAIPSPSGFTDEIVRYTGEELERLGVTLELTRRGAIRATLPGEVPSPDRAIVVHLDTIGAMVRALKPNGRIAMSPVGTWSSRFAEGARADIMTDSGQRIRGTILPLKASGHVYNDDVDTQKSSWDHVELRVDELVHSAEELADIGIQIGDTVAIDPRPEFSDSGFINSRHLDDKAGVAALLATTKYLIQEKRPLPTDVHLLFTISEEVGSGCSAVLHQDVAEMVTIDNATPAPGQNSKETGVTIAMKDQVGPFDFHLTRHLLDLCKSNGILHQRDVFRYYRSDSASALEAGNDIRTALVCFGVDASHGYERTHLNSLESLAGLLIAYAESPPLFLRDREDLAPLQGFVENAGHRQRI
ncbi:MAG: osmoprotectant NAGGN system M42 family peptidase [Oceanococcaceae bacterium]